MARGGEDIQTDLSWQCAWSKAAIQYLTFCEDVIYLEEHDPLLRTAIRGAKNPVEFFEYPTIRDRLNELKTLRAEELRKLDDPSGGAAAATDTQSTSPLGRQMSDSAIDATNKDEGEMEDEDLTSRVVREAERVIQRNITLFVEPATASELSQAIQASRFKDLFGSPDQNYVLIIYDFKQASESQTRPMTRIAPLKDTRLKMALQATLEARMTTGERGLHIAKGDMWLLFDGSRHGHHVFFEKKLFIDPEQDAMSLKKFCRQLRIECMESSVAERRAYCRRGVASLKSNECICIVAGDVPRLPQKKRRFFSGTNLGSSIVDVPLATQKEIWHLPRDEKKELYGKYQVPVGGKESDAEDYEEEDDEAESGPGGSTPKKARVDPKESVPVFYWQPSGMLCDEMIWMYSAVGIIDLTAGSGQWALAALRNSIPYFGMVLTPVHLTRLRQWLIKQVSEGMTDDASGLKHLSGKSTAKTNKQMNKPNPKVDKTKSKKNEEKDKTNAKNSKKKPKVQKKESDSESVAQSESQSESEVDSPL